MGEPDASVWFRLVERDRRLLGLLAEHKVLTTNQIAMVEFGSVRRAQDRLRRLRELGVLFAFRDSYSTGGTSQTRYALGYLGARLIAAQQARNPPTPAAYAQQLERLGVWSKLAHQLGVNDFFCQLAGYARRHPDQVRGTDGVGGLTQWWPENRCTEFFWVSGGGRDSRVRPDGYGCWEAHGRVVRFFLEHDTGSETLDRVTGKIADYRAVPTDRFGILLFSMHSTMRETNLRAALHRATGGQDPGLVIATAARDHGDPNGPAGPIWAQWTPRRSGSASYRCRLAELPERGPRIKHSGLAGQPFSQAAFDPHDRLFVDRLTAPQPPPAAQFDDEVELYDEPHDDLYTDDDPLPARLPW
jgi:hypothetical protein